MELSHVRLQRDLLRSQLDANRATMVQCAGLLARGRFQDCVRVALVASGVNLQAPAGNTAAAAASAACSSAEELPQELTCSPAATISTKPFPIATGATPIAITPNPRAL